MAYLDKAGKLRVWKDQGPAYKLIEKTDSERWSNILQSPRGLIHARARTKGPEADNRNNHPVTGFGWAVVHNGQVQNDDELFDYYKAERPAAVDTAAIPFVLSLGGEDFLKSINHLSLLSGGVTTALWWSKKLDTITLYRAGNSQECWLFLDPAERILYWSSASIAGRKMAAFAMANLRFLTMTRLPENVAIILEPGEKYARSWRIDRSSFFPRRGSSHHTTVMGPTTPINGQAPASNSKAGVKEEAPAGNARSQGKPLPILPLAGKAGGVVGFKFGIRDRGFPGKPVPKFMPDRLGWECADHTRILDQLRHSSVGMEIRVPTPYGYWLIRKFDDGGIHFGFRAHKRVKKWWRKEFKGVQLPASLVSQTGGGVGTAFDDQMTFEDLTLKTRLDAGGAIEAYGRMCPWCGAWAKEPVWINRQDRCPFCHVRSRRGGKNA